MNGDQHHTYQIASVYGTTVALPLQTFVNPVNENPIRLLNEDILDPVELGFIPSNSWNQTRVSLAYLQDNYFMRKNNVNRRFEHKLFNALRITLAHPEMATLVGVVWVTTNIIKVHKYAFAKLLNINCIDGGLFHKQGNFSRHGFVTLSEPQAKEQIPVDLLIDVDYRDVLLIAHATGAFTSTSSEESVNSCKWDNPAPVARIAALRIDSFRDANIIQSM